MLHFPLSQHNEGCTGAIPLATYAGVRVIILTPIYFFLVAALPRDRQHNTDTIIHPLTCNSPAGS